MKQIRKQKQRTRRVVEEEPEWVTDRKSITYEDVTDFIARLDEVLDAGA